MAVPATCFGKYRLYDRIAMGGMAEVFFATKPGDPLLERGCVIKRVLPHLAAEKQFITMFLDEAKLAARLNHPGIARIYDLGFTDEQYFIAMEYLFGEDCASIIETTHDKGRAGSWPVACAIVQQAAEVLHFAHEVRGSDGAPLNLVHRDVSPSNVFVTYDGSVKLLDFGIARWAHKLGHTQVGFVKGKAGYMAPEQAEGHGADRRSDVWALGVCLYELLTARPLFAGDTTLEVALKALRGNISPPSSTAIEVPRDLDAVVLKALAAEPRHRFATAQEFADALKPLVPVKPHTLISKRMRALFGNARQHPLMNVEEAPTQAVVVRRPLPDFDPSDAKTLLASETLMASDADLQRSTGDSAAQSQSSGQMPRWQLAASESPTVNRPQLKAPFSLSTVNWKRALPVGAAGGLLIALLLIVARC